MAPGAPVVGLWGTFDVDNYGDHLFPHIAAVELGRRLPGLELRTAAPYGSAHPTRFDGEPVAALPPWSSQAAAAAAGTHDLVVVGGGELLHMNDRLLAPVYGVPADELAQRAPSAWFADAALTIGRFAWNAVGVPGAVAPGGEARLKLAADAAAYVAVRDPS